MAVTPVEVANYDLNHGQLAQLVERGTHKPQVACSIRALSTKHASRIVSSSVEHPTDNRKADGSTPSRCTILLRGSALEDFSLESVEAWWRVQCILTDAQRHCRRFGQHSANPYHNLRHCETVAKVAIFYGMKSGLERNDLVTLGLAGLFHDFNHSGEPLEILPDRENIQRALQGFQQYSNTRFIKAELSRMVCRIIANTEVQKINGQIRFQEPTEYLDTFIRDADVSQLLFSEGREMQEGLAREMGLPFNAAFRKTAVDFLYAVRLYTEPAQQRRVSMQNFLGTWAHPARAAGSGTNNAGWRNC